MEVPLYEEPKRPKPVILAFLVPFLVVFLAGLSVWVLTSTDLFRAPCEYEDYDWEELDFTLDGACVRVAGMAHYRAVVKQESPGNLFHEARTTWLYGLFPPYETEDKAIRVLVLSEVQPEDLVSFELMKVQGRLHEVDINTVPPDTEIILSKGTDYFFTDAMVIIEAESIIPFTLEDTPDQELAD